MSATSEQQLAKYKEQERQLSNLLIDAGVGWAKRHPVTMTLWLSGLLVLQFATGFAVDQAIVAEYDAKMESAHDTSKAQRAVQNAYREYQSNSGIFGCAGSSRCNAKYAQYQAAQSELRSLEAKNNAIVSDAKAKLGVFSEYGVEETRGLFWRCFSGGKDFAKRSSWYDMMFMGISSMGERAALCSPVL